MNGDPHAVIGLSLPLLRGLLGEIGLGIHELWEVALPPEEHDDSLVARRPLRPTELSQY